MRNSYTDHLTRPTTAVSDHESLFLGGGEQPHAATHVQRVVRPVNDHRSEIRITGQHRGTERVHDAAIGGMCRYWVPVTINGDRQDDRLFRRFRGSSAGEGWAVAASVEEGEGDEVLGVLEAVGHAGEDADLGVG